MGYYLSEPAPSKGDLTAKNRVWGFFAESVSVSLETRRAALETHRENYGEPRKTASGIPLWPSRDPIGESGGVNLYGFVGNDSVNYVDVKGTNAIRFLDDFVARVASKFGYKSPTDKAGEETKGRAEELADEHYGRLNDMIDENLNPQPPEPPSPNPEPKKTAFCNYTCTLLEDESYDNPQGNENSCVYGNCTFTHEAGSTGICKPSLPGKQFARPLEDDGNDETCTGCLPEIPYSEWQ